MKTESQGSWSNEWQHILCHTCHRDFLHFKDNKSYQCSMCDPGYLDSFNEKRLMNKAIVINLIALVVLFCWSFFFLLGCAHEIPSAICAEYGGVKRATKNFIFCEQSQVYDRHELFYIPRTDEMEL